MKLADLTALKAEGSADIAGLAIDSKQVRKNFLFAALPGLKTHGIQFLDEALRAGASAVLTDPAHADAARGKGCAVIVSDNPRRELALIASKFYPRRPGFIAAVTGTNGKTSSTVFARQIWQKLGHKSASLGTIGLVTPDGREDSALTTPDAIALHRIMQKLAEDGVTHLAFEAGSHGLHQHRIDGVAADAAAFTNLTRDHLDYHRDMEDYFAAKAILFSSILKQGGTAVLNRDTDEFSRLEKICKDRQIRVIGFGKAPCDLQITGLQPEQDHQIISLNAFGKPYRINLPLLGGFQAMNAVCAMGLGIAAGADAAKIAPILETLDGVPGRMQMVARAPSGAPVFVDYAHTPDAIETVLRSLRPHARGKLSIVFGAGGDRDPGKRPLMGKIAAELADRVTVTDDNPRSEDPAKIRAQILAACKGAAEIGNREDAIAAAIAELRADDILIIAGKGHEQGQIVGKNVLPFDDAAVARHYGEAA